MITSAQSGGLEPKSITFTMWPAELQQWACSEYVGPNIKTFDLRIRRGSHWINAWVPGLITILDSIMSMVD